MEEAVQNASEITRGMSRVGENRWREMGKDFLRSTCKLRIEGLRGFRQTGQRLVAWEKAEKP